MHIARMIWLLLLFLHVQLAREAYQASKLSVSQVTVVRMFTMPQLAAHSTQAAAALCWNQ